MLRRIAPTLFQGTTGETVTIAAVAQGNNGAEAAVFRYGATQLPPRQVQGHPGCEFDVRAGTNTLGTLVTFDPAAPNASYELFEEDDSGILQPLQIVARPISGPIVQFQIASTSAAERAAKSSRRTVMAAARKNAKKAARKLRRRQRRRLRRRSPGSLAKLARKAAKKTLKRRSR